MPPYVLELSSYRPLRRLDGMKWTEARVFEVSTLTSAPPAGAPIQTFVIPDYPDAANPPPMSFTVTAAQLLSAWYWVVFRDAQGGELPMTPEGGSGAGVLLPPSPGDVRRRSPWIAARFPGGVGDNDDLLREAVWDSASLITSLTGRNLDGPLGRGSSGEDLDRLAMRATVLKTERILGAEGTAKARQGVVGGGVRLRSFSAGPYSESYFGPEEAGRAAVLDPDPALHEVLWALATDAKRAEWLQLWGKGPPVPFAGTRSFDWAARHRSIR